MLRLGYFNGAIDLPGNSVYTNGSEYHQSHIRVGGALAGGHGFSYRPATVPYFRPPHSWCSWAREENQRQSGIIMDPMTGAVRNAHQECDRNGLMSLSDGSASVPLAVQTPAGKRNLHSHITLRNYIWEWNITKVVGGDWYTGLVWRHNC